MSSIVSVLLLVVGILCLITTAVSRTSSPNDVRELKIIVEPNPQLWKGFNHTNPYPSTMSTYVSGALQKGFMKEVCYLQANISKVTSAGGVTFNDLCKKSAEQPCVISALQYFQSNSTSLDDAAYDSSGFFITADYVDHIMSCGRNPHQSKDDTALDKSCLTKEGAAISTSAVLDEYPGPDFWLAKRHLLTFTLSDGSQSEAQKWLDTVHQYLEGVRHGLEKKGVIITFPDEDLVTVTLKLWVDPVMDIWKGFNHTGPYPLVKHKYISGAFQKGFLKELYYLQHNITNITLSGKQGMITFAEFCEHSAYQPCIRSIMQYFQNNVTSLDDVTYDPYGFYVTADYYDHLQSCAWSPNATRDDTALNKSCLSSEGAVTTVKAIVENYPGPDFWLATRQVLTFTLTAKTAEQAEDLSDWLSNVYKYLEVTRYSREKRGVIVQYLDKVKRMTVVIEPDLSIWKDFNHWDSYPADTTTYVSGSFQKGFLQEVYYFQQNVTKFTVPKAEKAITFQDFCLEGKETPPCSNSVLQYFQNNVTSLDDIAMDPSGFLVAADWANHIISCGSNPKQSDDGTLLHKSCLSKKGADISPSEVLDGYPGPDFWLAKKHVVVFTMTIDTYDKAQDYHQWLMGLQKYMETLRSSALKRGVIITI